MSRRLPLHPRPRNGEALGFYIVRLASCMGYISVKQLLSATGLVGQRLLAMDNWRLMEHLSAITGHADSMFRDACFDEALEYVIDDSERHYGRLALREPYVCVSCMAVNSVVRPHWQYLPHTHCEKHGQKLLSACPICGEPFKWDIGLLSVGCTHCGTQWPRMVQSDCTVPPYQVAFQEANSSGDGCQFMSDLMMAAKKCIRPLDLIIEEGRISSQIHDWHAVLDRAYRLLSDKSLIQSWYAQCTDELSLLAPLGRRALKRPLMSLASAVSTDWEISQFDYGHHGNPQSVRLKSLYLTDAKTRKSGIAEDHLDESLRFQADIQTAAKIIGCSLRDITKMWKHNAIKAVNNPKHQRYAFFDMQLLANSIAKLETKQDSTFVKFTKVQNLLRFFDAEVGNVLVSLVNGDIPFFMDRSRETFLDGLWISPTALYRELLRQFKQEPDKKVLRYRLPRIIGMGRDDLDEMTRAQAIRATPAHGDGVFKKRQLNELTKRYFFAIRWANLHEQKLGSVRRKLKDAGIDPLFGKNVYPLRQAKAALRHGSGT